MSCENDDAPRDSALSLAEAFDLMYDDGEDVAAEFATPAEEAAPPLDTRAVAAALEDQLGKIKAKRAAAGSPAPPAVVTPTTRKKTLRARGDAAPPPKKRAAATKRRGAAAGGRAKRRRVTAASPRETRGSFSSEEEDVAKSMLELEGARYCFL